MFDLFSWLPSNIGSWFKTVLQTGLLLLIIVVSFFMLIKCLLKLITSILSHSTAQLMFTQVNKLEAAQHHGASNEFYNPSIDAFTQPPSKGHDGPGAGNQAILAMWE